MRDVIVEYNNPLVETLWEDFMLFFRTEKGYEDWTDEQIALSVNQDDIDEFCKFIKDNLSYDKKEGEE